MRPLGVSIAWTIFVGGAFCILLALFYPGLSMKFRYAGEAALMLWVGWTLFRTFDSREAETGTGYRGAAEENLGYKIDEK